MHNIHEVFQYFFFSFSSTADVIFLFSTPSYYLPVGAWHDITEFVVDDGESVFGWEKARQRDTERNTNRDGWEGEILYYTYPCGNDHYSPAPCVRVSARRNSSARWFPRENRVGDDDDDNNDVIGTLQMEGIAQQPPMLVLHVTAAAFRYTRDLAQVHHRRRCEVK